MKTLLNWSEISRRITGGRNRILENYTRGCDYTNQYIKLIKKKEKEIAAIIDACILHKKRSKKLDEGIESAISELGFKETLKGIMK